MEKGFSMHTPEPQIQLGLEKKPFFMFQKEYHGNVCQVITSQAQNDFVKDSNAEVEHTHPSLAYKLIA